MSDETQIQYSYRWGNSAYTPWVDVGEETEVEVHAGFFMKARIKPSRCPASMIVGAAEERLQCERFVHDSPGDDPVHEGSVGAGLVVRWTGPVKRMFPTWDGRAPEGH